MSNFKDIEKNNEKSKEEMNKEIENKMMAEIMKIELKYERVLRPFIKRETDNKQFPTFLASKAALTIFPMNKTDKEAREKFLAGF